MKEDYNDNELLSVPMGEKWGYINLKGEVVIPPQYDEAYLFSDGIACVMIDGKYGFINKIGETVIPCNYPFEQVTDEYWKVFVNKTPRAITPHTYTGIS